MSDTVAASPSQLHNTATSFHTQSSTISDLITTLNTSTSGLVSTISIAPLTSFSSELETLYGRIGISMNCFTDAMRNLGSALHVAAQGFSATDTHLANTFNSLDQALQPYVGFEAPKMALPTATQTHSTAKPQPPSWFEQAGSWISTQASNTWHWVTQHPWQTAGIVVGVVVIGAFIVLSGGSGAAALPALSLAF
jgi:uncharacterized protein YukE